MKLMLPVVSLILLSGTTTGFCNHPKVEAVFPNNETIHVFYAQAPLMSINKMIGHKFELLNMYHTALIFCSEDKSPNDDCCYTLEFDMHEDRDFPWAQVPKVVDNELIIQDTAARYCLDKGILHNVAHWTVHFEKVAKITPLQLQMAITDFMKKVNSSELREFPQYSSFNVVAPSCKGCSTMNEIRDITCGNGIMWFLRYLRDDLHVGVKLFDYRQSRLKLPADELRLIDKSSEKWGDLIKYFKLLNMFARGSSFFNRLLAFSSMFPIKFWYDTNHGKFYEIVGNRPPYINFIYETVHDPPHNTTDMNSITDMIV